jgi:hypothetical protein
MFTVSIDTHAQIFSRRNVCKELAYLLRDVADALVDGRFDGEQLDGSISMPVVDRFGSHVGNVHADAEDVLEGGAA